MVYSTDEKKRLSKVVSSFAEYLRNSPSADLLYSEKVGYVLIGIDGHDRLKSEADVIRDAEDLCERLLNEIYLDYCIEASQNKKDMLTLTEEEIAELRNRFEPYKAQLPEYAEIAERLLAQ